MSKCDTGGCKLTKRGELKELTVAPDHTSFRIGAYTYEPETLYLLFGPTQAFKIGQIPGIIKTKTVKNAAKVCQETIEGIKNLDESIRPKRIPDLVQWIANAAGLV
jgi:hypothetical protein